MLSPCLKSPQLAAFADFWYALRATLESPLPSYKDFPLETLAHFLPCLAITRRRDNGMPYYHFYGTELAHALGEDATGKDVFSNMTEEAQAQYMQLINKAAAKEKQDGSLNGRWFLCQVMTKDKRLVEVEGLTLPFTADGGEIRRATYSAVLGSVALGDAQGAPYAQPKGTEFDAFSKRPDWMFLQNASAAAE